MNTLAELFRAVDLRSSSFSGDDRPQHEAEDHRGAGSDRDTGLRPAWAKDRKMDSKLINARGETVTEKRSFRSSAAKRRAIIPAKGNYEWMNSEEGKKIPYFLHGDGDVIPMAGLYELWLDPELPEDDPNKWVWTCTVLTGPATDSTGHIHDRSR